MQSIDVKTRLTELQKSCKAAIGFRANVEPGAISRT